MTRGHVLLVVTGFILGTMSGILFKTILESSHTTGPLIFLNPGIQPVREVSAGSNVMTHGTAAIIHGNQLIVFYERQMGDISTCYFLKSMPVNLKRTVDFNARELDSNLIRTDAGGTIRYQMKVDIQGRGQSAITDEESVFFPYEAIAIVFLTEVETAQLMEGDYRGLIVTSTKGNGNPLFR